MPVLDAVVHHLHEVPGAVGTAMQIAFFGRPAGRRAGPGVRAIVSHAGRQGLKIGSSRSTVACGPPIIMQ